MPYILKVKVHPKENLFTKRVDRLLVYLSDTWKKLRLAKLMELPLCELCLSKGIIKSAVDVHHIISPFSDGGDSYDPDNLVTLCKECHGMLHAEHKEATLYDIYYKRKQSPIV